MAEPTRLRISLLGVIVVGAVALVFATLRLLPGSDDGNSSALLAVFAEYGEQGDRIYTAPADDPSQRTLLTTVEHASGWGINPANNAPLGRAAYTVAPVAGGGRDLPAELWVIEAPSGKATRLAGDADLLVPPVFTRDGNALLYRRSNGLRQEIVRAEIATGTRRVVYAEETTFGFYPAGEAADGSAVLARLTAGGTDIVTVREGEPPTTVIHASDHIARDWTVAPDGRAIAYLAAEVRGERVVYRAHVIAIPGGATRTLTEPAPTQEQFGPRWSRDGRRLAVGVDPTGGKGGVITFQDGKATVLAAREQGFDVPLMWGDGDYLAVRAFDGISAQQPGNEVIALLGPDAERHPIEARNEIIFLGWATRA